MEGESAGQDFGRLTTEKLQSPEVRGSVSKFVEMFDQQPGQEVALVKLFSSSTAVGIKLAEPQTDEKSIAWALDLRKLPDGIVPTEEEIDAMTVKIDPLKYALRYRGGDYSWEGPNSGFIGSLAGLSDDDIRQRYPNEENMEALISNVRFYELTKGFELKKSHDGKYGATFGDDDKFPLSYIADNLREFLNPPPKK